MSQSLESSTLYENNTYQIQVLVQNNAASDTLHNSIILNDPNNMQTKYSLQNYTRGRAHVSNSMVGQPKKNSMISHIVQSSPQHFSITNKLNESFEDNSTQHRNSSLSNSNGGGSFISRSGHGRILSEQNLSPLCTTKLSDLSNGGFSNSFNYGQRQVNTSSSSYSSLNENGEISNSLLMVKEYLDKDESLIDSNLLDILMDELISLNSNSIRDYYSKILSCFQNNDEYSQFFNESQFLDQQQQPNQQTQQQQQQQSPPLSALNPDFNSSTNLIQDLLSSSSSTSITTTNTTISSPMTEISDIQNIDSIQEFENSASQCLKIGTAMNSLIFQTNPSKHFRNTMVLTFDYYMTPVTFLLYIIKCYYIPTPVGLSEKEMEQFEKKADQIRYNIGQVIRDYVELRSAEFFQSNITSVLLIVFFQTVSINSKEKNLFMQLAEKVKVKKTQYELENVQKVKKSSLTYTTSMFSTTQSQSVYSKTNPQNTSFSYPLTQTQSLNCGNVNQSMITESEMMRIRRKNEQIQRQLALYDISPLMHYSTDIIAKVLAQIDAKWFTRLNLSNLLNSKFNVRSKSSYIQKYSNRFNYYVYWFMNQVLNQKSIDNRVNQIFQYIEIMCKADQEYRSYPTVHALITVISYMKMQLPLTWKRLEEKLRDQRKWMSITLELQRYQQMFNDKYYGYKQVILHHLDNRQNYIPCMNPYFQELYNDEMKFLSTFSKKSTSYINGQSISQRQIQEKIGDRLQNLANLQKSCEKVFPNLDSEYKDFRNYKNDESQLYTIFKKKSIKEIDDILIQNNFQFKDLELYFIGKCKQIEPN